MLASISYYITIPIIKGEKVQLKGAERKRCFIVKY